MKNYECVSVWLRLGPRVRTRVRPYAVLLAGRPGSSDPRALELLERRAEAQARAQLRTLGVGRGV